jgi:DNA-binding NarL/FixJ family response regulator
VRSADGKVEAVLAVATPGAKAQEDAAKARRAAQRSSASAERLRSHDATPAEIPSISPRETEVLGLSSHGLNRAEIAEALALSQATVRTHLENAYLKLGVSDKAAAVAAALRHGLIE